MILACHPRKSTDEKKDTVSSAVSDDSLGKKPQTWGTEMNRLSNEKSPYLLQHKDNPVHWFPWSDMAFEMAESENKPIFLSIGYATCHWCHVMAHESFEDEEVAGLLNRHFISIKVDREERPDIDHIYMSVAQLMTGRGGWPLTIIMTPDKKPFFAATYIPRESRFGSTGLMDLLQLVADKWRTERRRLVESSGQITEALRKLNAPETGAAPDATVMDNAFARLAKAFDPVHGGFSRGTKFPTPHNLLFLLAYYHRTGETRALQMVETTLKHMRAGGIFDHLGYGFHRYATDNEWLVPHFEKMLYDQALLMLAYTDATQVTGNPLYARVVDEIASYLNARLISPEGGFFSAEDADSEAVEGKYYVWTRDEINSLLDQTQSTAFNDLFQIKKHGNFDAHQTPPGTNIPHMTLDGLKKWVAEHTADKVISDARRKLLAHRDKRIPPLLDDKMLTDWNGLAIAALARAGRVLQNPTYTTMAIRAADFIGGKMMGDDHTLLHRFRNGDAAISGQLDDYAFLIFGLIELYETTFEPDYLEKAITLAAVARKQFIMDDGSYCLAASDATDLIVRPREFYDGALPSGNSVMLHNLTRLSHLTGNPDLMHQANQLASAFSSAVNRTPEAHTQFMLGLYSAIGPSMEIVIAGESQSEQTRALLAAAQSAYNPNRVVLLKNQLNSRQLAQLAPYTRDQVVLNNQPTAYVCTQHTCKAPTHSPDEVRKNIAEIMK